MRNLKIHFPLCSTLFIFIALLEPKHWGFLTEPYKALLHEFLFFPNQPILTRFFKLFIFSNYGSYSLKLSEVFSYWGLLHALVISGSQVSGLVLLIRTLFRSETRVKWLSFFLLTLWSATIGCQAPFVRACLLVFIRNDYPQISWPYLFLSSLLVQAFILGHYQDPSFYLSWLCFIIVNLGSFLRLNSLTLRLVSAILLCLWCQISAAYIYDFRITTENALSWTLANLILTGLFEKPLQLLCSVAIGFCATMLLLSLVFEMELVLGLIKEFRGFFHFFYTTIGHTMLVGLFYFRYN